MTCALCIIYLISYVFWFQNLHFQHIWKGKCYNKRSTAYFKKKSIPPHETIALLLFIKSIFLMEHNLP